MGNSSKVNQTPDSYLKEIEDCCNEIQRSLDVIEKTKPARSDRDARVIARAALDMVRAITRRQKLVSGYQQSLRAAKDLQNKSTSGTGNAETQGLT